MQNSSSLISIIVPSFNAAAYLPGLCRSLQSQTYKKFEVVIGDDGSTDQTYKVIKQFLKDKRFSYYKNKINQGLCSWEDLIVKPRSGQKSKRANWSEYFAETFLA